MAKFNAVGFDELAVALQAEAERMDRNGPAAAMAGAAAAIQCMRETVPKGETKGLRDSIQAQGPYYNAVDGHHADVFPSGKNKYGERYETIGYVLEYGRSNMDPRPWMRTAMELNGEAISSTMAEALMRD